MSFATICKINVTLETLKDNTWNLYSISKVATSTNRVLFLFSFVL